MFDKLIDFLISIIELFRFFFVVRQWEEGVMLIFGKYTGKIIKPGFHFMWPLAISEVHTIGMLPDVVELEPQTIATKDKIVVVVQALVKYQVNDSETCLLKVGNEQDALKEFTQGAIHTVVNNCLYNEVNIKELEKQIIKEARKEVNDWGIKMHSVTIKSFGKMTSIRLIQ
jgi:regulator of protease activity HflC (stomatin/prohibitin superfamily)